MWLIANGGAICDRSIVVQLYDKCGFRKAIGWCCHSHFVTPPGLWGLQGLSNTRTDPTSVSYFLLCPDLQIILPLLQLMVRSVHNILFYEFRIDHKIGRLDIHFGCDVMCKLSLYCLRTVHVITHARSCIQHKEDVNPAVFTILVGRNTTWVALDKYRKESLIQKPNCILICLLIYANSTDIRNWRFMVLSF